MWDALRREFEGRTAFVQNDLRHKISLAKCGENENVCEHTDQMHYMFEELAGMGVVMGKFGSEPWSEPELDRTGPYFRFRFGLWSRTGPTVPFEVQQVPSPC